MKKHMTLGDFLVGYLRKIGVKRVFGIPGDLALKLFFALGQKNGLEMMTLSHEPGVGFAADGYARATGKIAVVCVTYGAGGHNMVNPVAGSFSERVPLLIFSGGPGEEERKLGTLIHHQAREIESQHRIYREVTCASRVITDPHRAARDVHDVVTAIWAEQRPGYIEIHRDMVDREIEVPDELIEWDGRLRFHDSDPRKVEEAARETAAMFNASHSPVLIAGIEMHRYKLSQELVELAEKMGAPVFATVLGKGAFPMDHPLYMGVHVGPISPPPIVARMDEADFVLNLGCLKTDMNFGNRPPHIIQEKTVWAVDRRVDVKYHTYTDVGVRDLVRALLRQELRHHNETVTYASNLPAVSHPSGTIRVSEILGTLNDFLANNRRYMVVAESGDMLFGGLDVRVRGHGTYLAQGFYASMGFAVPAAMGAQIGCGLRPIVLSGDGGFQMTGSEISHAPRLGTNPIVIVVNNGGWAIFRPVAPDRPDLLEIPPWPYARLAQDWGGAGFEVNTASELRAALDAAHACKTFAIIDVHVRREDLSPVTLKYIRAAARRSQPPAERKASQTARRVRGD